MSISCIKCNYAITEPLCASCIVKDVKIWFYEKSVKKITIRRINKKLKSLLMLAESLDYVTLPFEYTPEESIMKCIKCKNGMPLICFHCINNQTSRIINENIRSTIINESFQESFNTELYDYELKKEVQQASRTY